MNLIIVDLASIPTRRLLTGVEWWTETNEILARHNYRTFI